MTLISRILFAGLVAGTGLAAGSIQAQVVADKHCALSLAFKKGDAKTWRRLMLADLLQYRADSEKALQTKLERYHQCSQKHGVQGLETVLTSAVGELSARGVGGYARAQLFLQELGTGYALSEKFSKRPNAFGLVLKPGSETAHYVPLDLARAALETQLKTGITDPDEAFETAICGNQGSKENAKTDRPDDPRTRPEDRARFDRDDKDAGGTMLDRIQDNWGADKAELAAAACKGGYDGPGKGGTGPGFLRGTAVLSCLMSTKEPSRSERLTALTQDCFASIADTGNANPLASEAHPVLNWTRNQYDLHYQLQEELQPGHSDAYKDATQAAEANAPDPDTKTTTAGQDADGNREETDTYQSADGNRARTVTRHADGSRTERNYAADGTTVLKEETFDGDGNRVQSTNYDSAGNQISQNNWQAGTHSTSNPDTGWTITYNSRDGKPIQYEHVERDGDGNVVRTMTVTMENEGGYTLTITNADGSTETREYNDRGERTDTAGDDGSDESADAGAAEDAAAENPTTSGDPNGPPMTEECLALSTALFDERNEANLTQWFGLDPRVARPAPDAEVSGGEQCLPEADTGLDNAFQCDQFVHCPGPAGIAKSDCGCGQAREGLTPDRGCERIMTCSDGVKPVSQNGQCVCMPPESDPIFVDPMEGGGPNPMPVDLNVLRNALRLR